MSTPECRLQPVFQRSAELKRTHFLLWNWGFFLGIHECFTLRRCTKNLQHYSWRKHLGKSKRSYEIELYTSEIKTLAEFLRGAIKNWWIIHYSVSESTSLLSKSWPSTGKYSSCLSFKCLLILSLLSLHEGHLLHKQKNFSRVWKFRMCLSKFLNSVKDLLGLTNFQYPIIWIFVAQ